MAAGIRSFTRHGGIRPATRSGWVYLAGLVLSVFTSFGLSSTGGVNAGHALSFGIRWERHCGIGPGQARARH